MNMTVENDKNVNIDGSRTTTIGRLQDDTVTGDATFLYKAKRTTTVNGLETANLNAHQTVNIKGGRDLTIIDGGDKIDITGNQSFKLDGAQTQDITQTQHVTVKGNQTLDITEGQQTSTINKGQTVNITAGGQHHHHRRRANHYGHRRRSNADGGGWRPDHRHHGECQRNLQNDQQTTISGSLTITAKPSTLPARTACLFRRPPERQLPWL